MNLIPILQNSDRLKKAICNSARKASDVDFLERFKLGLDKIRSK